MVKKTEFGMQVLCRLNELGQRQDWLIEQVREKTGDYFDSSYLHRLLTGKLSGERGVGGKPGKAEVIREILGMNESA